ncbi:MULTISPECIES: nitroreductase [unclassified Pseudodesulfovibrio]|uniref:nitroreductase family protein n=1 Tax=unclassified Pseudodesulfovibrio TaxID=2661612 RepID=UPI000FEBC8EB|nr:MULTISPECIES: nitroreductase [unclassified Pseudodesulfovibrio]MCJ2163582.1 nitroreductase [Pseudodesulfovibrio sp. S3-i]RWU06816.1 nitroreductase family protein [Pseudodesulfovibrio sp. S3]
MSTFDNPVLQAILDRRSIRKFTDEPVSRQDITTILTAGQWAPSGLNNQPWRFMVVTRDDPRHAGLAGCTKYAHVVRASSACICVLLEKAAMYNEMKDHQGVGACIQNMLLAIHALGLGAVWIGQIVNDQAATLGVLGKAPEEYELQAVIALGHPDQKGSSDRKPLSELMLEDFQCT